MFELRARSSDSVSKFAEQRAFSLCAGVLRKLCQCFYFSGVFRGRLVGQCTHQLTTEPTSDDNKKAIASLSLSLFVLSLSLCLFLASLIRWIRSLPVSVCSLFPLAEKSPYWSLRSQKEKLAEETNLLFALCCGFCRLAFVSDFRPFAPGLLPRSICSR